MRPRHATSAVRRSPLAWELIGAASKRVNRLQGVMLLGLIGVFAPNSEDEQQVEHDPRNCCMYVVNPTMSREEPSAGFTAVHLPTDRYRCRFVNRRTCLLSIYTVYIACDRLRQLQIQRSSNLLAARWLQRDPTSS